MKSRGLRTERVNCPELLECKKLSLNFEKKRKKKISHSDWFKKELIMAREIQCNYAGTSPPKISLSCWASECLQVLSYSAQGEPGWTRASVAGSSKPGLVTLNSRLIQAWSSYS